MALSADIKITPTLFERLCDDEPKILSESIRSRYYSIRQLRASVAQDLESLLNSRKISIPDELARNYPETINSMFTYGMIDFVGLSLLNPQDRDRICQTLAKAIERHEPRLRHVRVVLEQTNNLIRGLHFALHAILSINTEMEAVSFDATMLPNTQQYQIKDRG